MQLPIAAIQRVQPSLVIVNCWDKHLHVEIKFFVNIIINNKSYKLIKQQK